jgi:hypothetical protein
MGLQNRAFQISPRGKFHLCALQFRCLLRRNLRRFLQRAATIGGFAISSDGLTF